MSKTARTTWPRLFEGDHDATLGAAGFCDLDLRHAQYPKPSRFTCAAACAESASASAPYRTSLAAASDSLLTTRIISSGVGVGSNLDRLSRAASRAALAWSCVMLRMSLREALPGAMRLRRASAETLGSVLLALPPARDRRVALDLRAALRTAASCNDGAILRTDCVKLALGLLVGCLALTHCNCSRAHIQGLGDGGHVDPAKVTR